MKTELIKEALNKYIDRDLFEVDEFYEAIKYSTRVDLGIIHSFIKKVNVPLLKRKYGIRENPYFALTSVLGDEDIDIDTFIKRVPFYFYIYSNKEREISSSFYSLMSSYLDYSSDESSFYSMLDELHYENHLSLDTIFGYVLNQFGNLDDFSNYVKWYEFAIYMNKCSNPQCEPKNFLHAYNHFLIEQGKELIRSTIDSWKRTDREIVVSGNFPFNSSTKELDMSWILLWVNNAERIYLESVPSNDLRANIHIVLKPDTFIYQYIGGEWDQLYVGPEKMLFDLEAIKQRRKEFKYNQEEVANIIGVSVRSYKYFEQGKYVPNGLQLIRLMNLLNFNDVEALIYKENIIDENLNKFLSGRSINEFLKARDDE